AAAEAAATEAAIITATAAIITATVVTAIVTAIVATVFAAVFTTILTTIVAAVVAPVIATFVFVERLSRDIAAPVIRALKAAPRAAGFDRQAEQAALNLEMRKPLAGQFFDCVLHDVVGRGPRQCGAACQNGSSHQRCEF
ncbi:hypothetical protein, partial [Actibacterium sp.]|uniref:hypothetical protein n=1 Tax=Actibacterium sp. TaxID=1872125 RepID=UPI0035673EEE